MSVFALVLLAVYIGTQVAFKLNDIWYRRKLHEIREQAYSEVSQRRSLHDDLISTGVDAALDADRLVANYMLRLACLERVRVRRLERLIEDVESELEGEHAQ